MSFPDLLDELSNAVAEGVPERRAEIVGRVADVFVGGSAGYSAGQIEFFDDAFMRIAAMIEVSARAALADRLAKDPRAPAMISRALACDDEIAVAAPMLEHSQLLDIDTLVVAASTKSQDHLLAISRRSALDEAVTDVLVERGDKPVMLNMAANPKARFSDNGYKNLVKRSDGDDELTTRVALRTDMPREHLARLLVRASRDVQLKLEAAHPAMAKTIQEAVAEAATKILDKTSTLSRDYSAARKHVEVAAGRRPARRKRSCGFCGGQQIRGDGRRARAAQRYPDRAGRSGDGAGQAGGRAGDRQGDRAAVGDGQGHPAPARRRTRHFAGRTRSVPRHVLAAQSRDRAASARTPRTDRPARPASGGRRLKPPPSPRPDRAAASPVLCAWPTDRAPWSASDRGALLPPSPPRSAGRARHD